jgi:hypothetical protein
MVRWPAGIEDCYSDVWAVGAQWENDAVHKLFIGAVAGALEATFTRPILGPTNCYELLTQTGCNVSDVVRVNLPSNVGNNRHDYMHLNMWNSKTDYRNRDCCDGDKRVRSWTSRSTDLVLRSFTSSPSSGARVLVATTAASSVAETRALRGV